jgi:hypothetical protein
MDIRALLPTLVLLTLCACGTRVSYIPTNSPPRALSARSPQSVEVFSSQRPSRAYVEVGLIETQQESMYSTDEPAVVFGRMREEAARQGCDAVIVLGSNDAYEANANQYGGSGRTLRGYRGACIVWTEDVDQAKDAVQSVRIETRAGAFEVNPGHAEDFLKVLAGQPADTEFFAGGD